MVQLHKTLLKVIIHLLLNSRRCSAYNTRHSRGWRGGCSSAFSCGEEVLNIYPQTKDIWTNGEGLGTTMVVRYTKYICNMTFQLDLACKSFREVRMQRGANDILQLWSGREVFELEYIGNGMYRNPVSGTTVIADITECEVLL